MEDWEYFIMGLIAPILLIAIGSLILSFLKTAKDSYNLWVPRKERAVQKRIIIASSMIASPCILRIKLPWSYVFVWRTTTSDSAREHANRLSNAIREMKDEG